LQIVLRVAGRGSLVFLIDGTIGAHRVEAAGRRHDREFARAAVFLRDLFHAAHAQHEFTPADRRVADGFIRKLCERKNLAVFVDRLRALQHLRIAFGLRDAAAQIFVTDVLVSACAHQSKADCERLGLATVHRAQASRPPARIDHAGNESARTFDAGCRDAPALAQRGQVRHDGSRIAQTLDKGIRVRRATHGTVADIGQGCGERQHGFGVAGDMFAQVDIAVHPVVMLAVQHLQTARHASRPLARQLAEHRLTPCMLRHVRADRAE
jgi:hypothetical protein